MTFARANSVGWAFMELLTSDQMNVIDEQLPFALDGRDGGTYHPGAAIVIDGDLGTTAALQLKNVVNDMALYLSAVNGSAATLIGLDGTVHGTWIAGTGAALSLGFEPLPLLALIGHSNDSEQGSLAGQFTGGQGSGATGAAGTGARGVGGVGFAEPYRGGTGLIGEAGASDFTSGGASSAGVLGGVGVLGYGGPTTGNDNSHWGGIGLLGAGGDLTGTGHGGMGVRGRGGMGPLGDPDETDVGEGVRGEGSIGVHGVATLSLDPRLPNEFNTIAIAGLKGSAKNIGRSFLAEFSGNTAEGSTAAVRWIGDTGTGETAIFSVEAALQFNSIVAPDFTTLLLCTSNVDSGPIRGARIEGRGRPAGSFRTFSLGGTMYPSIEVVEQTKPNVNVPGGLAYLDFTAAVGQVRDAHFLAGPSRMDRIVTSGDPGAAFAWCRVHTDGSGNISLTNKYGVDTFGALTLGSGTFDLDLYAITGGPAASDLCPMISASRIGGLGTIVTVDVISATKLRVQVFSDSGGAVDLLVSAGDIFIHVHAAPSFGLVADRAGYFTP